MRDSRTKNYPKLLLSIFAVAVLGLGLAACGGDDGADDGGEGGGETVSLGFIMEARPADQPWSAAIHDAGEKLKESDPDTEVTETFEAYDPTAAEPVARQLLDQGTDVLVMHSFALEDVAKSIASEYPDVPMSVSSFMAPIDPNLTIATASYLQIGYGNCWLLAKLSESKKIGIVGPQPIPYATELVEGCELGAKAADPEVEVLSAYGGDFTDQQATLEQSRNLVNQGADGLFPSSATEDSLGGFQVCEQEDVNCVGWASAIDRYAPKTGVVSAVVDWSVMLQDLVAQARDGQPAAETFDATYENGGLIAEQPEGTASRIPDDVKTEFDQVIEDLASGAIELPKSKAHPCCP